LLLNRHLAIIKEQAIAHKLSKDYRSASDIKDQHSQVDVRVVAWADSAITLRAYIWTDSQEDGFLLKTDLYYSVKKEFEANGIEIPYPHRTIVYKNNEQK